MDQRMPLVSGVEANVKFQDGGGRLGYCPADIARHVIQRTLSPRLSNQVASYDVSKPRLSSPVASYDVLNPRLSSLLNPRLSSHVAAFDVSSSIRQALAWGTGWGGLSAGSSHLEWSTCTAGTPSLVTGGDCTRR